MSSIGQRVSYNNPQRNYSSSIGTIVGQNSWQTIVRDDSDGQNYTIPTNYITGLAGVQPSPFAPRQSPFAAQANHRPINAASFFAQAQAPVSAGGLAFAQPQQQQQPASPAFGGGLAFDQGQHARMFDPFGVAGYTPAFPASLRQTIAPPVPVYPPQQPQQPQVQQPQVQRQGQADVVLTEQQSRMLFGILDEDDSGSIDYNELLAFFLNINIRPDNGIAIPVHEQNILLQSADNPEFRALLNMFDTDGDGTLSFDEFRTFINATHVNVRRAIFDRLNFITPEVNIGEGGVVAVARGVPVPLPVPVSGRVLTKNTNLSLPGKQPVTLELLQRHFKQYGARELESNRIVDEATIERLSEPGHVTGEIHRYCRHMVYSEKGLKDLINIGLTIFILVTFTILLILKKKYEMIRQYGNIIMLFR
jgi:hypothetical protein